MHCNNQSIKSKFDNFEVLLKQLQAIKLICLNEHNIDETNKLILNKLSNFKLADSFFRSSARGGSCILVHEPIIDFTVRCDLKRFNEELIFEGSYVEIESLNLLIVSL